MTVYLFQYILIILLYYSKQYIPSKGYNKFVFFIVLTIMVLIGGFRFDIGQDSISYVDAIFSLYKPKEFTFTLIVDAILKFRLPNYYILVIYSFITYLFLLLSIEKYNKSIQYLIILIFLSLPHYYFQTYNIIRQMASVTIFAYAVSSNKSSWIKLILLFTSILFHTSAIAPVILLILFKYTGIKTKYEIPIYLISLLVVFIPSLTEKILSSIPAFSYTHYYDYVLTDRFRNTNNILFGPIVFLNIIITLIILYNKKRFIKNNLEYEYILFFIGQVIWNLFIYDQTIIRISYYFVFFYIILVPYLSIIFGKKYSNIIKTCIFALYTILFINYILSSENPYIPYKNVLLK